jgi:tetratricopeptide (TPR) repeat protein
MKKYFILSLAFLITALSCADPFSAKTAHAHLDRGRNDLANGKYDSAIKAFGLALKKNSSLQEGYLYRGIAYSEKGDHIRAIADFTAALRINPEHAEALNNRGNAHFSKGGYDNAAAYYNAVLKINPGHPYAKQSLGLLLKHRTHLNN